PHSFPPRRSSDPVGANGSAPAALTDLNGVLLFSALDSSATGTRRELWRSDCTAAGLHLVRDIYAGTTNGCSDQSGSMVAFQGRCYFAANDGVNGVELWQSDGTPYGT